jgi:hypothetical protein
MRTFRKGCASSKDVRTFEGSERESRPAQSRAALPLCTSVFSPIFSSALRHPVTALEDEGDPQIAQMTQI